MSSTPPPPKKQTPKKSGLPGDVVAVVKPPSPPKSAVGPVKPPSPPKSAVGPAKKASPPKSAVGPAKKASPPKKTKEEEFEESLKSFNRRSFTFLLAVSLVAAIAPNRPGYVSRTDKERHELAVNLLNYELSQAYDEEMKQWCDVVWTENDVDEVSECGFYGFSRLPPPPIEPTHGPSELLPLPTCTPFESQSSGALLRAIMDLDTGLVGYTSGAVNEDESGREIRVTVGQDANPINTVGKIPEQIETTSAWSILPSASAADVPKKLSRKVADKIKNSAPKTSGRDKDMALSESTVVIAPPKTSIGRKISEKLKERRSQLPEIEVDNGHIKKSENKTNDEVSQLFTEPIVDNPASPEQVATMGLEQVATMGPEQVATMGPEQVTTKGLWGTFKGIISSTATTSPKPVPEKKARTKKALPKKPKKRHYVPKESRDPKRKGSVAEQVADKVLDNRLQEILDEIEKLEFGFNGQFMGMRRWHIYFSEHEFYSRFYNPLYILCCNLYKALKYGSEFAYTVFGDLFSIFETVGVSFKTDAKVGTIQLWPIYRLVGGTGCIILLLNYLLFLPLSIVLRYWGYGMQFALDVYDYDSSKPQKPKRIFWDIMYYTMITSVQSIPKPFIFLYNWIADTVMDPYGFTFFIGDERMGENYNTVLFGDGEMIRRGEAADPNAPSEYGMDTDTLMHGIVIPFTQLGNRIFYMIREFNSSNIFIVPEEVWNKEAPKYRYLPMTEALRSSQGARAIMKRSRLGKKMASKEKRRLERKRAAIANAPTEYGLDIDAMVDIAGAIASATSNTVGERWLEYKMEEYGSPTPEELCASLWNSSVGRLGRWFTRSRNQSRETPKQHAKQLEKAVNEMCMEMEKDVKPVCTVGREVKVAIKNTLGDFLGGGAAKVVGDSQSKFNRKMVKAIGDLKRVDGWTFLKETDSTKFGSTEARVRSVDRLMGLEPHNTTVRHFSASQPALSPSAYTRKATARDLFGFDPNLTKISRKKYPPKYKK